MDVADFLTSVGKTLFGRPVRLKLALWILESAPAKFFQDEATRGTIEAGSAVRDELLKLEQLGMVEREPSSGRRQYYRRTHSPLWGIITAAAEALREMGGGNHPESR